MSIAAGSASEAEHQLLLARDLGYLTPQAHEDLQTKISEIKKMLNSLIQKLSEAKS